MDGCVCRHRFLYNTNVDPILEKKHAILGRLRSISNKYLSNIKISVINNRYTMIGCTDVHHRISLDTLFFFFASRTPATKAILLIVIGGITIRYYDLIPRSPTIIDYFMIPLLPIHPQPKPHLIPPFFFVVAPRQQFMLLLQHDIHHGLT